MEMNDTLSYIVIPIAGGLLGLMFFGGLWWTIRRSVTSRHPASLFLASLFVRMSLTMLGFYGISGGRWDRLLLCLAGFVMARLIVTWIIRASELNPASSPPEVRHAP